jgi:hypothetical protein
MTFDDAVGLRGRDTRRARLLEVAPELSSHLTGDELSRAREYAVLPTVSPERGVVQIEDLSDASGVRGRSTASSSWRVR